MLAQRTVGAVLLALQRHPTARSSAALDYVREGDTLTVWRLDRLGRSLKHLVETRPCSR